MILNERNPGGAAGASGNSVQDASEQIPDSPDPKSDQDPAQAETEGLSAPLPHPGAAPPVAPPVGSQNGKYAVRSDGSENEPPLRIEKVNEVTFKVTNGEMSLVPRSHGQWGGYLATTALAWVIDIGSTAGASPAWLARCRDRACGPMPFSEAKAAAIAMAKGAIGDVLVEDPVKFLLSLQAELAEASARRAAEGGE